MPFVLPAYRSPDFSQPQFKEAPTVEFKAVAQAGVAPDGYHGTSIYPEYFQLATGKWRLLKESRMDCVVVLTEQDQLSAVEFRNLKVGDRVACGRQKNGEGGPSG